MKQYKIVHQPYGCVEIAHDQATHEKQLERVRKAGREITEISSRDLKPGELGYTSNCRFTNKDLTGLKFGLDDRDCRGANPDCGAYYYDPADSLAAAKAAELKAEKDRREDSYYSCPWR